MNAVSYARHGDPSVLEFGEHPLPEPGRGEIRIRTRVSGVNPIDWKSRSGAFGGEVAEAMVPGHDGAGIVDKVGPGVERIAVGDRVWVTLAAYGRPAGGTAQEYAVVPVERVFPLPVSASFDLGASIGIPALTAHRALTVAEDGLARLAPGSLAGRTVLVAGGAGAVGGFAIKLARWAGATVITTVSNEAKGRLATASGAHHVLNYREVDVAQEVMRIAPGGVDQIVEVAAGTNAELDRSVLRPRGTVAIYSNDGGAPFSIDIGRSMGLNARFQFVLLLTLGWDLIGEAAEDINHAIEDGALAVGSDAGLPLLHFPLRDAVGAHLTAESQTTGKVLITVA